MFFNQGTRQPEASQPEKVNGDMASVWEELDDVQLATVVGGVDTITLAEGTQFYGVEYKFVGVVGPNGVVWDVQGKAGDVAYGTYEGELTVAPVSVVGGLVVGSHLQP